MRRALPIFALGLIAAACSSSDPAAPGPKESLAQPIGLTVNPVKWNPSARDVGKVQAVTDEGNRVVVFGESGATLFEAGNFVNVDASVKAWTSAAPVPANDAGTWLVGISNEGRVLRMKMSGELEDVSGRWGLEQTKVAEASALGGEARGAVFRFDGGFALADGKEVRRFALPALAASGSGGRAVAASATSVCFAKTPAEPAQCFPYENALYVAALADGGALVATAHTVDRWTERGFERVHDAGSATIHGMVVAGARVWLAIDRELALYEGGGLRISTSNPIANEARLAGSPSGDVWAIASDGLTRFGATVEPEDERIWRETVQPANARVCQSCHGPPGSGRELARIDLSTYALWSERRASIGTRVIVDEGKPRAMPPPSSGFDLTKEERDGIRAWSERRP